MTRSLTIGVTGNIACGKSLVLQELAALGLQTIDADVVYHGLIGQGRPLVGNIAARFGPGVVAADGGIDRKALATIVFANPADLADLGAITQPAIRAEINRIIDESPVPIVALDAIRLIEGGLYLRCDEVWVVICSEQQQIDRLMERNHLTREAALQRIRAQSPASEKERYADRIVDNRGTPAETRLQVRAFVQEIRQRQEESER